MKLDSSISFVSDNSVLNAYSFHLSQIHRLAINYQNALQFVEGWPVSREQDKYYRVSNYKNRNHTTQTGCFYSHPLTVFPVSPLL